jgi:putative transposase
MGAHTFVSVRVHYVFGTASREHAIKPDTPVAKAVQTIKANSSRWIRETAPGFAWQEGYAAFSVSISHTDATIAYVQSQAEHHKRRGYGEELAAMLRKHHMHAVT